MNETNSLRRETYVAASKFHQAYERVFVCLSKERRPDAIKAAGEARAIGAEYQTALKELIKHLAAQGPQFRDELMKTQQLAETLEKELAGLDPYKT